MKKFKKYLLMIPLLAVMLFNCVCYGQVIAADDSTFPVFLEPSDFSLYDFSDVDTLLSDSHLSSGSKEYYFTCAFMSNSAYNNFLSGGDYEVTLYMFYPKSFSNYVQNDDVIMFNISQGYKATFKYTASSDTFNTFDTCSGFSGAFYYDKTNGSVKYDAAVYSLPTSLTVTSFLYERYYFFQGSNIPDFPLVHDYSASQSAMNVNVTFSPEFNGEISRTVKANGTTTTLETFNMTVTNNSKFNIQYLMAIYPSTDYFSPFQNDPGIAGSWAASTPNGKTYVGNPSYVYVKDEWIYLPHGEQGVITGYAPSSWHYLNSGATDDVTINFNQLKLDSTMIYEVSVYAVRNDYDYVSPYTDLASFQWGSDYCIDSTGCERVYDSVFRLLNPATFNPNNNEGSYAFDVDDTLLFNRANGYIDENGEVVIDRVDTNHLLNAGTDPDDPWRGWNDDDSAWEVYNKNQNTVSSDISQLSNNFGSFFRFINKVYSYFPKNYQTTIILGLTAVVVIAILKVVF